MGDGARAGDEVGFFAAAIEVTRSLSLSTTSVQLTDAQGPLAPGRYVIQLRPASSAEIWCWVHAGPFIKGDVITATTGEGRNRFPLSNAGLIAIEFHVRRDVNDRIAAVLESGSGTLYISKVSWDH